MPTLRNRTQQPADAQVDIPGGEFGTGETIDLSGLFQAALAEELPPPDPTALTRGGEAQSVQRPAERTSAPTTATPSPDFTSSNIQRNQTSAQAPSTQAAPSRPSTPTPVASAGDGVPSVFQPLPTPPASDVASPRAQSVTPTLVGAGSRTPVSGNAGGLLGGGLRGPAQSAVPPDVSPLLLTILQMIQGGR